MSDLVGNPEDRFSHNEAHINPNKPSGLSRPYNLDGSTFIYRGIRGDFIFYSFFNGIHVRKQNSPRWDAVFCGVTSGATLVIHVL